eukprot:2197724-Pyramimonas_sp.AAC.1
MKYWSNNLAFVEECQAISKIADVSGHSWIPFLGEDLAAMSSTGKPVTDFFRPFSQMRNGSHLGWTCSVHILSDSAIVFKDKSGPAKPSLLPEYSLRNSALPTPPHDLDGRRTDIM